MNSLATQTHQWLMSPDANAQMNLQGEAWNLVQQGVLLDYMNRDEGTEPLDPAAAANALRRNEALAMAHRLVTRNGWYDVNAAMEPAQQLDYRRLDPRVRAYLQHIWRANGMQDYQFPAGTPIARIRGLEVFPEASGGQDRGTGGGPRENPSQVNPASRAGALSVPTGREGGAAATEPTAPSAQISGNQFGREGMSPEYNATVDGLTQFFYAAGANANEQYTQVRNSIEQRYESVESLKTYYQSIIDGNAAEEEKTLAREELDDLTALGEEQALSKIRREKFQLMAAARDARDVALQALNRR